MNIAPPTCPHCNYPGPFDVIAQGHGFRCQTCGQSFPSENPPPVSPGATPGAAPLAECERCGSPAGPAGIYQCGGRIAVKDIDYEKVGRDLVAALEGGPSDFGPWVEIRNGLPARLWPELTALQARYRRDLVAPVPGNRTRIE